MYGPKGKKKGGTSSSGVLKSKSTGVLKSKSTEEAEALEDVPVDLGKPISIFVNRLYNLEQASSFDVIVTVEHVDNVLGSTTVTLLEEDEAVIDLQTELLCFTTNPENMDQLVTNPLMFTVVEIIEDKDKPSKPPVEIMLGKCNLDLKGLFMGETLIQEELILEQMEEQLDMNMVTWPNLPRLSVCITVEEPIFNPDELENINILCLTVESLYNISPDMTEKNDYAVGCKWPVDFGVLNDFIVEGGIWNSSKSNTVYKQWPNITDPVRKAANSKYRLFDDETEIKTNLQIDLQAFIDADAPRIEWNTLRRCIITKIAGHEIFDRLSRYNCWPVELQVTKDGGKGSPRKGGKTGADKASDKTTATKDKARKGGSPSDHFWGLFDITNLLYPGVKSTRAAAQICTFSQPEMAKVTGILEPVFREEVPEDIPKQKPNKKRPDKTPKGTPEKGEANPEEDAPEVIPLVNPQGDPIFMVIQVQFFKPLHLKRPITLIEKRLLRLVPPAELIHRRLMTAELAHEHYQATILNLSEEISRAYRRFKILGTDLWCVNEENEFITFLHKTGAYNQLKETLQNKIIVLVREKCIDGIELNDEEDLQNHIQNMYIYLTEEMHSVINAHLEGVPYPRQKPFHLSSAQLVFFSLEAEEEGNVTTAQEFHLKRIAGDRKDPKSWIDYACFCIKQQNPDKAEECIKEALSLDIRNTLGLLMYGIFRTEKADYYTAEMIFEALTCFHPTFVEGWVAFHLFYLKTDNCPGAHVTLSAAKKCFADVQLNRHYEREIFYHWDPRLYNNDNIFLLATTTFVRVHAYEFVEMALAQQLVYHGTSLPYYYYLSVSHYFQKRYQDALDHLLTAIKEFSMDVWFSCMIGHCYFKLRNKDKALQYYRFAFDSINRPRDAHLTCLRLGTLYLERGMFRESKEVYKDIVSYSPTPLSWLGLGLAYYLMKDYEDAEAALCEANILDNRNSTIWAYLTLINLHFERRAEFEICYRQLVKLRSVDEDLMHHIIKKQRELHYPDPAPLLNSLCTWM